MVQGRRQACAICPWPAITIATGKPTSESTVAPRGNGSSCAPATADRPTSSGALHKSTVQQIALAAIAWLAYEGGALRRCNQDDAPVGLAAAGPYLLVRREAFDAVGGYEAMRQNVLVDVALARRLREAGFRYRYLASGGCVHARMYRSLPEIWRGFAKNAYLALGGRIDAALCAGLALGALVVLPPALALLLLARGELVAGSLSLAAYVAMTAGQQRGSVFMGTRVRWLALLLSPFGALLWLAIVAHSAWRTHSRSGIWWKGRSLPVVEPASRAAPPARQGNQSRALP
jgi:glycosyl transferase family 21